jgi:hypothetical protein
MHTEISPWVERLSTHRFAIAAGALFLGLAIALAWVSWRWDVAEDRMELLQKQAEAGFLLAPTSSRVVRIDLRAPGFIAGGGEDFPERIDLLIHAPTPRHARFRVSLLRADGTLLLHADQMVRDSNQNLRLSLNTSVLPAGQYVIRVEGAGRGGRLEAFAQAPLQIAR